MSPVAIFRWSLVLSPAAAAAGAVYSLAAASRFSQDWQDVLAWNGDGSWLPLDESQEIGGVLLLLAGAFAVLVAALANQVAMFFFWPPSRLIYAFLCAIGFVLTPALGLTVQPPLETLGYELSAFIAGVTLVMAYLPPVSERFKRRGCRSRVRMVV
jgi:hypothetical protein